MARKHYPWTRRRQTRSRPNTPAPTHGWLLSELAQLTGLPSSTLRFYLGKKLLRPIERRGVLTRYDRRQLLRLLGLVRLRGTVGMTLAEKQRKLDALGNSELETWLRTGPLPKAAAAALGFELPPTAAAPAKATQASVAAPSRVNNESAMQRAVEPGNGSAAHPAAAGFDAGRALVEHWQRIALLPGLDLIVHGDAPLPAKQAAQRIIDEYVVK